MKNLIVALLGATIVSCASSPTATQGPVAGKDDPCYDADIAAKRVWNEETRVQVKATVMQWGGEIGVDTAKRQAEEITSSMDRVTDDWARMRKAVCKDHFTRATLSKAEYQQRADCLDRLLTRQRTFLNSLTSPQADVSKQLAGITQELESC
jgi:hypothetical protein